MKNPSFSALLSSRTHHETSLTPQPCSNNHAETHLHRRKNTLRCLIPVPSLSFSSPFSGRRARPSHSPTASSFPPSTDRRSLRSTSTPPSPPSFPLPRSPPASSPSYSTTSPTPTASRLPPPSSPRRRHARPPGPALFSTSPSPAPAISTIALPPSGSRASRSSAPAPRSQQNPVFSGAYARTSRVTPRSYAAPATSTFR